MALRFLVVAWFAPPVATDSEPGPPHGAVRSTRTRSSVAASSRCQATPTFASFGFPFWIVRLKLRELERVREEARELRESSGGGSSGVAGAS